MLLTIDIGNTNMVLGVFEGDTIVSKSTSGPARHPR
jgi:pantothenate kinase type III